MLLVASVIAVLWDLTGPKGTFLAGAAFALFACIGLVPIRRHFVSEDMRNN